MLVLVVNSQTNDNRSPSGLHDNVYCKSVLETSNCPEAFFPNNATSRLDYQLVDHACDHRGASFRPLFAMT